MAPLRGITVRHFRGYGALVACSAWWHAQTGVGIDWDRGSSPDGAPRAVAELARHYDLIIVDHPQIGQIVREGCLLPLNAPARVAALNALARQSVGESFASYRMGGEQWALPISAAAQVQAWRPDRLPAPLRSWDAVLDLARRGHVLLPMRPPHSLLVFFTLCANLGQPCAATGESELNDPVFGASVLTRLRDLLAHVDPACFAMDPGSVCERMTEPDADAFCAPLIFGDVGYARAGVRPAPLAFADIPAAGRQGPVGAVLGGAGIAVSAHCATPEAARDFAYWLASAEVQRGRYVQAGGQPGNAVAWRHPGLNAASQDFYRDTWATLDGAWVRPRHDGYMAFQGAAAERINEGLLGAQSPAAIMTDLNRLFANSFKPP